MEVAGVPTARIFMLLQHIMAHCGCINSVRVHVYQLVLVYHDTRCKKVGRKIYYALKLIEELEMLENYTPF